MARLAHVLLGDDPLARELPHADAGVLGDAPEGLCRTWQGVRRGEGLRSDYQQGLRTVLEGHDHPDVPVLAGDQPQELHALCGEGSGAMFSRGPPSLLRLGGCPGRRPGLLQNLDKRRDRGGVVEQVSTQHRGGVGVDPSKKSQTLGLRLRILDLEQLHHGLAVLGVSHQLLRKATYLLGCSLSGHDGLVDAIERPRQRPRGELRGLHAAERGADRGHDLALDDPVVKRRRRLRTGQGLQPLVGPEQCRLVAARHANLLQQIVQVHAGVQLLDGAIELGLEVRDRTVQAIGQRVHEREEV
mmetsp:Transcript_65272/g.187790  ORF Transcript_65272/g.187790 Transcript_65272/m.187790 type:complete len:300 (+) Transcript_65272:420-1319(+)